MHRQIEHQYYLKSTVKERMEHIQGRVGKGSFKRREVRVKRKGTDWNVKEVRDKRTGTDWE